MARFPSLAAQNVEAGAARRALRDATANAVYGRLRAKGRAPLLLTPAVDQVERLREVVVSSNGVRGREGPPVELHDVATVNLKSAPRRSITRIDEMAPTLPSETRLEVATDKSRDVRQRLRALQWGGGIRLLLVVLVLLLMLRSLRAAGVVLFTVAVALAVALALLEPLGLTLNLITLGGLVLAFGLLVENSVIVTEQLILRRERSEQASRKLSRMQRERRPPGVSLGGSAEQAVRTVALPLVGGTLTIIAVMLPLVYLSGDLRELFLPFGVLTALTLAA